MKYREKLENIDLTIIAKAIGKSESTASRIRTRRKPDLDEAQSLVSNLKFKPSDFFV